MDFRSARALEAWLTNSGIDTAQWGTHGAKTVADLWHEYKQGEITFLDHPPTRVARVVRIFLRRGDDVLLEIAQEFSDGRLRKRQRPPSEKIIATESPDSAALRCLLEELGLEPQQVHVFGSSAQEMEVLAESPSYPGLRTEYRIYTVEATAEDLLATDFWLENKAALEGDPVKRHLWGWRRPEQIPDLAGAYPGREEGPGGQ